MPKLELIATTAFGLEAVVGRELKQLGYDDQTIEDGRVTFAADEAALCRTNIRLRSADRVLVKLGEFDATDFGQLFDRTRDLPWDDWIPRDAAFPVRGRSVRSALHSVPDCQAIVKKAVVEKLKQRDGGEWLEETGPSFPIDLAIQKDRALLTLDSTGPGLHKRGYRTHTGAAPLKETLAAALVQLSYWNGGRPLVDPCCGTGTIPIEAAMIGLNIAPGLNRNFLAEQWPRVPTSMWNDARTEARDDAAGRTLDFTLIGTDVDSRALELARLHAAQAGVAESIHFQQKPLAEFTSNRKYGCIICNPPYGERMGERDQAEALYRNMAARFAPLETWSVYVLTSHSQFEQHMGRKADRRRKLYNGRIACTYYQFNGPRPPANCLEPLGRELNS